MKRSSGGETADAPGWYPAPGRPGLEQYWDGTEWSTDVPPRPKPEPAWKQARVIALGVLIAVAVLFVFWRMSQPSSFDCLEQQREVVAGDRVAVESACR